MKQITICCLIGICLHFSQISIAQKTYTIKCEQLFFYIKQYWQNDSLGQNGLRLLASDLMNDCFDDIIKGKKWRDLQAKFGKPNKEFMKDDLKIYRYQLTNWENPSYLDIGVNEKGEVVKYLIWEIDG
jgi:hypothetical protein